MGKLLLFLNPFRRGEQEERVDLLHIYIRVGTRRGGMVRTDVLGVSG